MRHDPESLVARSQQLRRENNGWWGAAPRPIETAQERRRRNVDIRATMGGVSDTEWEARREWGPREGETAEQRRRNLEIRTTMGGVSRTRIEARRERRMREGEAPPPMYQLPAPAYDANPGRRHTAPPPLPQEDDAPPAYESRAVWPTGVRAP